MRCSACLLGLLAAANCDKTPSPTPASSTIPADIEPGSPPSADTSPQPHGDLEGESEPEPATPEPGVPGGGPDPLTLDSGASTSVGSPSEGRLTTSVPLPLHGPGYVFNPRKDPQRRHGTVELVAGLIRAAAAAQEAHPGGTLTVGDLSLPQGGDIGGHASHRAGRDVDVMFYLLGADQKPFAAKAIPIEPDGTGVDYRDLTTADDDVPVHIDVPRTWAFVAALVDDPRNDVARIFVVEHVRTMLLDEGAKVGADKAVLERVGQVTCQPKFPHDDHMHIRFFCSPDDIDAGCLDTAPIFPWHRRALAQHGKKAALAGPRTKPKPKLTSVDDAAKKARDQAGAFAPEVDAFLERRKAWAKKPKTGRKYCR